MRPKHFTDDAGRELVQVNAKAVISKEDFEAVKKGAKRAAEEHGWTMDDYLAYCLRTGIEHALEGEDDR